MIAVIIISQGISKELCNYVKNVLERTDHSVSTLMIPINYDKKIGEKDFSCSLIPIITTYLSPFNQVIIFMDRGNRFTDVLAKIASEDSRVVFIPTIALPVLIDIVDYIEYGMDYGYHNGRLKDTDILGCIWKHCYQSNIDTQIIYNGEVFDWVEKMKSKILEEKRVFGSEYRFQQIDQ